jgi:hypothetical protein
MRRIDADDAHAALDAPIARPAPREEQDWDAFLHEINDLRTSGDYDWADETLGFIAETVEKTERVTVGQRTAVANITNARRERPWSRRAGSRRYEGYR